MPCNDITENLVLSLDNNYAIQRYSLRKKTCGAKVGQQSLLQVWARTKSANEFIAMEMDDFLIDYDHDFSNDYDRFIALKHFDALRMAMRVLCGYAGGSKRDAVVVDLIEVTNDGVDVRMYIGSELDPSGNTGCGTSCSSGGCGGGSCKKT